MVLDGECLLNESISGKPTLRTLVIGAVCAAFLICSVPAAAQTVASSRATQPPASQQSTIAAAAIPSYPDSPAGLEKLIKDMLKIQKEEDAKDLSAYTQSLILPDPAKWFTATFGDEMGGELAAAYDRTRIDLPLSFPDSLAKLRSKHVGSPHATRFTDSCNPNASDTEYPLLLRRVDAQPLYDVRFDAGSQYFSVKYFAYVDGAFRWLGSFQLRPPEFHIPKTKDGADLSATALKVAGNVIRAKIIKQVQPAYPPDALYHRMQDTVLLHALIDADGSVQDLQVLQGACSFADASLKAVHQWRYSPTMLNGQPVKVDTTITVNFQLGR